MRRLLTSTALVRKLFLAAVAGAALAAPAYAANVSLTETSFSVTITNSSDGTTITKPSSSSFAASFSAITNGEKGNTDTASIPNVGGGWSSAYNLFTINPSTHCNGGGCAGGLSGLDTETVSLTFNALSVLSNHGHLHRQV
jgi:hypothetical protein